MLLAFSILILHFASFESRVDISDIGGLVGQKDGIHVGGRGVLGDSILASAHECQLFEVGEYYLWRLGQVIWDCVSIDSVAVWWQSL